MVGKLWNRTKQYIVVIVATFVVLLLYMRFYGNGENSFISMEMNRPMDKFIESMIQESEVGNQLSFSSCEYNVQNVIILLFCKIAGNVYQGVNAYYMLSFFLISVAMFWYLKKLPIATAFAVYGAVMISLIPFHIDRGEGQIITSTFFLAPIFAGMWNDIIYEERVEQVNKCYLAVMFIAPFIDISLSIMALILMLILTIHKRNNRVGKIALIYLCPLAIISMFLQQITKALSTCNLEQSIHLAREEGLRVLDMVMPLRYHVWDRLWNLRYEYDVAFAANGESGLNSMGTLLSAFFVISMLILFLNLHVDRRISWLAWGSVLVILLANVSGFNLLIEYVGIHVGYWNRMGIFIVVHTVAVMGILADRFHKFLNNKISVVIINLIYSFIGVMGIFELLLRQNMFS